MENEVKKESKKGLDVPSAIIVAGFLIALAIFASTFKGSDYDFNRTKKNTSKTTTNAVNINDVSQKDAPYIGEANAPVVLAYWADFQCPFCKKFEKEAMSEIVENYVKTGKVKIVFKDYAFLGPDSDTAGITGRAVWELYPEKYWEWREAMFTAQDEEHGGFGDEISVMKLTIEIPGIDGAKIAQAIKDKNDAYRALMEGDRAEGANAFGINGTPAVITGEELL